MAITPKMQQVGNLLITGKMNREIASELHITETNVKQIIYQMGKRLNMRNRVQLAIFFSRSAILLLLAIGLHAQTITVTGPASVPAGTPITATLTLSNNAADGAGVAAVQFAFPSAATAAVGSAAAGVNKQVTCNQAANLTCVIYANNNATNIPNGIVATVTFTPATSGTISLANLLGASAGGSPRTVTVGAAYSFSVTGAANACDIDGNGVVNSLDVDAIAKQITTANPSLGPTVVNLIRVYLASLPGGVCQ